MLTNAQDKYYALGKKSAYFPSIVNNDDLFLTTYESPIKLLIQNKMNKMIEFRTKVVSTKTILNSNKGQRTKSFIEKESTINSNPLVNNISPKGDKVTHTTLKKVFIKKTPETVKDYNHFLKIKSRGNGKLVLDIKNSNDLMNFNFTNSTVESKNYLDDSLIVQEAQSASPITINKNQQSSQTVSMNRFYKGKTKKLMIDPLGEARCASTGRHFLLPKVTVLDIKFKTNLKNQELYKLSKMKQKKMNKKLFLESLCGKSEDMSRAKTSTKMTQTKI